MLRFKPAFSLSSFTFIKKLFSFSSLSAIRVAENWFKIGKGVCQGCILYPAYLTYMQSTSWEMPGWMKHKLESRLPGEISIVSDMQMTPPLWQTEEARTIILQPPEWKPQAQKLIKIITWITALCNKEATSHAVQGHPRWMGGEFWQNMVHWKREWQPFQCSCLKNPISSMKRQ